MGISFNFGHSVLPHKCYDNDFADSLFWDVVLSDDLGEAGPKDLALSQKRSYYKMGSLLQVEERSRMLFIGYFESADERLLMKIFLCGIPCSHLIH